MISKPGDYIPGIDTTIKVGKIRGVESHGMMLSEREMQLSDAHTGIVELDPDAPVGARYIDVVPFDPVIDVAVTPNRPDALGVAGIARDLAARGLGRLTTPPVEPVPGAFPCPVAVYLAPDVAGEACPLFVGRLIRGVRNGPSPAVAPGPPARHRPPPDLGARRHHQLHHLRPQPPAARLRRRQAQRPDHRPPRPPRRDHPPRSTARTTPSTAPRRWSATPPAPTASAASWAACAPAPPRTTTDVFVEAAYFDPVRTARTGRRLEITSDARYRFERGVDPAFTPARHRARHPA